jgi:glutathione S-transferase
MADELVFYTNPMSRGRIARWMLEEIGQPYRTELLDFGTTMKAVDYLNINPMGKVPAIRHGDAVVTEAFPGAGLAPPPADRLRAPYYRWLFFAAGPLEAAVTNKALGFVLPEGRGAMAGYGNLADVLNALERLLSERDYVAGDNFTAADVYLGAQIGSGLRFGTIEKRPAFEQYWARLGARPAAARARQIDDALVAERKKAAAAG